MAQAGQPSFERRKTIKKILCVFLSVLLTALIAAPALSVSAESADAVELIEGTYAPGQVIVMFKSGAIDTDTAPRKSDLASVGADFADLLYRPAFVTDPAAGMTLSYQPTGDDDFDTMYKAWFDSNVIWSYYDSAYPWTRLGYTYDWADNGTEYGLSEFIIFSGADVAIEYTCSVRDFVRYAKAQ